MKFVLVPCLILLDEYVTLEYTIVDGHFGYL